jgi:hypothetical protein
MQQVQQRELSERMSWARAIIFGVGFFFIAAILIGQFPGYINLVMTAATLQTMEQGTLGLALVCLGGFAVIQCIVLLFDPKPVIPPAIFTFLGLVLTVGGLAICIWATATGCTPQNQACNQYFPTAGVKWNPLIGGNVLWFEPGAVDFLAVGLVVLGVGLAWIFYSVLAMKEQRDPDRRDLGTTPGMRWMIVASIILLILFIIAYNYVDDQGLAVALFPQRPFFGLKLIDLVISIILGAAIFLAAGALALRLHYLMRPVRKRTMSGLYAFGALGLAQLGALFLIIWIVTYPLIDWMQSWTFIGLGSYLTACAKATNIPASCSFSQEAGYIVNAIITTNFFALLMAAIYFWRTHRNFIIIGSIVTVATIAAATLVLHTAPIATAPGEWITAMLACGGMLVLASIWSMTARREFAVVGEKNLGCLGMWLVVGTCLLIYLAAFAFFSIPQFTAGVIETAPNIPFVPGAAIPAPTAPGAAPPIPASDAVVMLIALGIIAGIQFFFLARNRYKV